MEFDTRIGMEVVKYSFMTLRNWGDDKAAGIRCTIQLALDNDIQLCVLDDIDTDNAYGCTTFDYKLPKIKL